jgi:hypothetical protein
MFGFVMFLFSGKIYPCFSDSCMDHLGLFTLSPLTVKKSSPSYKEKTKLFMSRLLPYSALKIGPTSYLVK